MLVYRYNAGNYYVCSEEAYLDPLETEHQGKDVYLIPANCTTVKPPKTKDGFLILWNGEAWEYEAIPEPEPEPEPTLDEVKQAKITELKSARDTLEVEPVSYNDNLYDFDEKSMDRLAIALKALQLQGAEATIDWTMANNCTATITAQDITMVFATVAQRSNLLHSKYRELKEQVLACDTAEAVKNITFE